MSKAWLGTASNSKSGIVIINMIDRQIIKNLATAGMVWVFDIFLKLILYFF